MAVILLSGGLDSALNLAIAARQREAALAITFSYGQRAEARERAAASALARHYQVPHQVIDLRWLGEASPNALTRSSAALPHPTLAELEDRAASEASAAKVWVANRNGILLNAAAAFAEARGDPTVIAGFNREEAATFPDNSAAYLEAVSRSFAYSTRNSVRALSHTIDWDKTRIIEEALQIELPLDLVWSCYEPGPERCWKCESCQRTARALGRAGARGAAWLQRLGWTG